MDLFEKQLKLKIFARANGCDISDINTNNKEGFSFWEIDRRKPRPLKKKTFDSPSAKKI